MDTKWGRLIAEASGLGVTMGLTAAAGVTGGLLAGRKLDAALGTGPILTIVLAVVGAIVGQIAMVRIAQRARAQMLPAGHSPLPRAPGSTYLPKRLGALVWLLLAPLAGAGLGVLLDNALKLSGTLTIALPLAALAIGLALVVGRGRQPTHTAEHREAHRDGTSNDS